MVKSAADLELKHLFHLQTREGERYSSPAGTGRCTDKQGGQAVSSSYNSPNL